MGLTNPEPQSYINIKWQEGTVTEHGVNGAQIDDVLQVLVERIQYLNSRLPCSENDIVLAYLHNALAWDRARTAKRREQNVEGTEQPHVSSR